VVKDVPPGSKVIGFPAVDRRKYAKMQMALKRVENYQAMLRDLQKEVAELSSALQKNGAPKHDA